MKKAITITLFVILLIIIIVLVNYQVTTNYGQVGNYYTPEIHQKIIPDDLSGDLKSYFESCGITSEETTKYLQSVSSALSSELANMGSLELIEFNKYVKETYRSLSDYLTTNSAQISEKLSSESVYCQNLGSENKAIYHDSLLQVIRGENE